MEHNVDFSNVHVNAVAALTRQVGEADAETFAALTGDTNPIHLDATFAANSPFGCRIAHGILIAGYISAILGSVLPGPGSIYLGQTLSFRAPVYFGETIKTTVVVKKIREDKPVVTLQTMCMNEVGQIVIEGEATMLCPGLNK